MASLSMGIKKSQRSDFNCTHWTLIKLCYMTHIMTHQTPVKLPAELGKKKHHNPLQNKVFRQRSSTSSLGHQYSHLIFPVQFSFHIVSFHIVNFAMKQLQLLGKAI